MERYDALLAETCADVNMIRRFDTTEEISYDDRFNAITFIDPKTLEAAFDYDYSRDPSNRNLIVRGHNGRIYGSGCFDDARKEAKYQAFIHDAPRVAVAMEAMERLLAQLLLVLRLPRGKSNLNWTPASMKTFKKRKLLSVM
jgi:hypothetical protein